MTWRHQARRASHGCGHDTTETHRVAGVERSVCPSCGHVSFDLQPLEDREIERERFARPADGRRQAVGST